MQILWRLTSFKGLATLCAIASSAFLHTWADVSCATWNLKWFPSGRRNVKASVEEEASTIRRAGATIGYCLNDIENGALQDKSIVFLQEVRDAATCTNLVRECGIANLRVVCTSNFKDASGLSLWQQTSILSTLPVLEAGCEVWRRNGIVNLPRGFSYAVFDCGTDGLVACFNVHLKSNLNFGGSDFTEQENILKRERSAIQILSKVKSLQSKWGHDLKVVVAGDFNTNEDDMAFVSEETLRSFYGAHFNNCFTGMKKKDRTTHPGNGRYEDATFDYILHRGFSKRRAINIYDGSSVSDHNVVVLNLAVSSIRQGRYSSSKNASP